jgi:predicted metal-binding protein
LQKWVDKALELGALRARVIPVASVKTAEWVRWKCRFGCGGYGGCLTCPPHSPTPQDTARLLADYRWAVLFESPRSGNKEIPWKLEREVFLAGHFKAFAMASGPCHRCETCCLEVGSCRHPEEARPAMEACGIDVFATVRRNGFEIEVLTSTRQKGHYYGMVLIE